MRLIYEKQSGKVRNKFNLSIENIEIESTVSSKVTRIET